jgi:hypothetical protein
MKVASIGECMVELSDGGAGLFSRAFGGDTLNTALYLARLGIETSYVTALGDDSLSSAMLDAWRAEGIHVDEVLRLPGRMPGLYMIERNALGERSFLYWRDRAPAREFFDLVDDAALERLSRFDWLYLSGITLSLYGDRGRAASHSMAIIAPAAGAMRRRRGGRSIACCPMSTWHFRHWKTSSFFLVTPMPTAAPRACAALALPRSSSRPARAVVSSMRRAYALKSRPRRCFNRSIRPLLAIPSTRVILRAASVAPR